MSAAPTAPRPADTAPAAGAGFAACLLGAPPAVAVLWYLQSPACDGTLAQRYTSHPVEWAEVVLFGIAVAALALKALGAWLQRRACRRQLVPAWDGKPVAADEAAGLLAGLRRLPRRLPRSWAGRRFAAVLDYLCQRRSTVGLDDQMRCLADADAVALDGTYAFVRFVNWSIPILGFLGTVLGIAESVSGVTPELLEQSISTVTEGLALAFDTTALALMLTMVTMFTTFAVERREQAALAAVDELAERELAHRFARPAVESAPFIAAVEANSAVLLGAMDGLVRTQADVWAKALAVAEGRRAEAERQTQEGLTAALAAALAQTLAVHDARLADAEARLHEQTRAVLEPLAGLAAALRPLADGMQALTAALGRLQEEEGQLLRLERSLEQNLQALAGAGAFEQALHSLTAAVHLLTVRATPAGPWRVVGDAA